MALRNLAPVATRFMAYCIEIDLRDAALIPSLVGTEFSTSVSDRCQPKIARNVDSYGFVAIIPVEKVND